MKIKKIYLSIILGIIPGILISIWVIWPIGKAIVSSHSPRKLQMQDPIEWNISLENVSFQTSENKKIYGWYTKSRNNAIIIITHGDGGNRSDCLEQASLLIQKGYGVLLFDLLANGQSEGNKLTLNGEDVLAAIRYIRSRTDSKTYKIGLWGFSLGGMVNIQSAAQTEEVRGLVADDPYPIVSIKDIPQRETLMDWFWMPFDIVKYKVWDLEGINGAMNTMDAIRKIAPRPILLVSGARIPSEYRVMREYARAGTNVILWEVPEAGHMESWQVRKTEYIERVLSFFNSLLIGK